MPEHDPSTDPPTDRSRCSPPARVLITGATGNAGSEVRRWFESRPDRFSTTGCSARGDESRGIVAWTMGEAALPDQLRGPWDIVVHAAARTRWSMTPEVARAANVTSTEALESVVGDDTHLIYMSTAHATGLTGSTASTDVADYRNAYEWSKAEAERHVQARFARSTVLRFPAVFGRRSDGQIEHVSGFFKLLPAVATGLVPAVVAVDDALLDIVPVDDIAELVGALALDGPPATTQLVALGGGERAPQVREVIDTVLDELNQFRSEQGSAPLDRPPVLDPERWERFFLPFASEHFSPLQMRTIEVFSEFKGYFAVTDPFFTTHYVDDVLPVIRRSVRWWAETNTRRALATPAAWR